MTKITTNTVNTSIHHDEINGNGPATAAYDFIQEPHIVNQAAILPPRPHFPAGRSLKQVHQDERAFLSQNGKKEISKETILGTSIQTIPRGNYRATIALNESMHKFFERDGFRVTDYFVPNAGTNGQTYQDKTGQTITIHSGATSSFNRLADTVTLLRKIEGGDGVTHCYACRVDQKGPTPTAKAEEMAKMVFLGEFKDEGGHGIKKIGENHYTLQFAVQSVLGSSSLPFLRGEVVALRNEIKAYDMLVEKTKKEPLKIIHPETGQELLVQVLPSPISQTQFNWINQLSMLNDSWVMGEVEAKELSAKADASLFKQAEKSADKSVLDTVALLKQDNLKPWEEVMLRAYLCHLLNIPQVIHCKSSVDRTGVAVGIVSSMKQWIQSGRAIPVDANGKHNILQIVNERITEKNGNRVYPFKELFACNLRKGLVETELSREKRGLKLNRGWCQSLALQDLVPSRYLKNYDAKDTLARLVVRVGSFILGLLTIIFTLGGILKAIRTKSLKGFDVWLAPFKAFRPGVFPTRLIDETTAFGKGLLYKGESKKHQAKRQVTFNDKPEIRYIQPSETSSLLED